MKPRSVSRRGGQSTGCLILFFGVFLAMGSALTWLFFWIPVSGWWDARSWQEVPCTVAESRVCESSDSDGSTYRVEVTFDYVFNGGEYRSSRYNFMDAYSSGYDGKAAVVAAYPPGTRTTCWADPANPTEAVLNRGFTPAYLFGLIPLIFVVAGAGGIIWAIRQGRRSAARTAGASGASAGPRESPFGVEIPPDARQLRVLKPQLSRLGKLIGMIFLALFWNGIVSVFLVLMVKGWQSGDGNGCLTAFLVPFVLVGLGLIYAVFQQFLVLFNPSLQLTLNPGVLAPGEAAILQWTIGGRAGRVQKLRIVLEGREEATYRQGTDTKTDREVFATIPITETDHQMLIANGTARVEIPEDAMPSFSASRNKVVWTLKAVCEIPGWPDSDDEYEIVVAPAALR